MIRFQSFFVSKIFYYIFYFSAFFSFDLHMRYMSASFCSFRSYSLIFNGVELFEYELLISAEGRSCGDVHFFLFSVPKFSLAVQGIASTKMFLMACTVLCFSWFHWSCASMLFIFAFTAYWTFQYFRDFLALVCTWPSFPGLLLYVDTFHHQSMAGVRHHARYAIIYYIRLQQRTRLLVFSSLNRSAKWCTMPSCVWTWWCWVVVLGGRRSPIVWFYNWCSFHHLSSSELFSGFASQTGKVGAQVFISMYWLLLIVVRNLQIWARNAMKGAVVSSLTPIAVPVCMATFVSSIYSCVVYCVVSLSISGSDTSCFVAINV